MVNLKFAVDRILDRRSGYDYADKYYEGNEEEVFSSPTFARLFAGSATDYRLNFSRTVVDAVNNRLELAGVVATTEKANKKISEIWEQNELFLETNEIHKRALVYGECYVIVWPDAEGKVEISYNSPKNATMIYDDENPRIKTAAVKMWEEHGTNDAWLTTVKITHLNVYYADRVEKYTAQGSITGGGATPWTLEEVVENPWGEIPVFHFRTGRPFGTPEHRDAWAAQDMVNKLVATHMETVDYQGAPQRYALTGAQTDSEASDFNDDETDRENIDALRNGPGQLWYLKGVTNVGQFAPADHKVFTESMTHYVRAMASLTGTPLHYFEKNGSIISGAALRAAEAPLTKKVQDRRLSFGSTWKDVFVFALKIEGVKADVEIKWTQIESLDSLDDWETAVKMRAVGIPLWYVLESRGIPKELAHQLEDEAKKDAAAGIAAGNQSGMNAHNLALQNGKNAQLAENSTESDDSAK
jgi:hypothetical protein